MVLIVIDASRKSLCEVFNVPTSIRQNVKELSQFSARAGMRLQSNGVHVPICVRCGLL